MFNNLFDRFVTEWYHTWVIQKTLNITGKPGIFVTHMNGNRNGESHPYLPVYTLLGQVRGLLAFRLIPCLMCL